MDSTCEPEPVVVLSEKTRKQLKSYSNFGHIGVLVREAIAYIEWLEKHREATT